MKKSYSHPKIYKTQVYCHNNLIFELLTTKVILHVDIWAGSHPFYTKENTNTDFTGNSEKFYKKYKIENIIE